MTKDRAATLSASFGVALLCGTAVVHLMAYASVVSRAPADLQPIFGAAWVAVGVSLILAALLAIAATPLFVVRRRALLAIAALTPLSIAVLQIMYLGFIPPTALLLVDAALLLAAGMLGRASQPRPTAAA
jgi:hypothetical protein